MAFRLESSAFASGDPIPVEYTCMGRDVSPELLWYDVPPGTKSFTLIMDDPDTIIGLFTHWTLANIPAEYISLPEGVNTEGIGIPGVNDYRRFGYGGPCPPRGRGMHRYFFRLYALTVPHLDLDPGFTRDELDRALNGYVIEVAELLGTFER